MLKKLTDEQQQAILESAIEEFGSMGLERARISSIARQAGISVGVIYKYYENKEALFSRCLEHSIKMLEDVLATAVPEGAGLMETCEKLVRVSIGFARENPRYIEMYHAITMSRGSEAAGYAAGIEGPAAALYKEMLTAAQARGEVRPDLDPGVFAVCFDDILMMLHFSFAVDYYDQRLGLYMPEAEDREERLVEQVMKFLSGALGAEWPAKGGPAGGENEIPAGGKSPAGAKGDA